MLLSRVLFSSYRTHTFCISSLTSCNFLQNLLSFSGTDGTSRVSFLLKDYWRGRCVQQLTHLNVVTPDELTLNTLLDIATCFLFDLNTTWCMIPRNQCWSETGQSQQHHSTLIIIMSKYNLMDQSLFNLMYLNKSKDMVCKYYFQRHPYEQYSSTRLKISDIKCN